LTLLYQLSTVRVFVAERCCRHKKGLGFSPALFE
jgi:hypothetical protein